MSFVSEVPQAPRSIELSEETESNTDESSRLEEIGRVVVAPETIAEFTREVAAQGDKIQQATLQTETTTVQNNLESGGRAKVENPSLTPPEASARAKTLRNQFQASPLSRSRQQASMQQFQSGKLYAQLNDAVAALVEAKNVTSSGVASYGGSLDRYLEIKFANFAAEQPDVAQKLQTQLAKDGVSLGDVVSALSEYSSAITGGDAAQLTAAVKNLVDAVQRLDGSIKAITPTEIEEAKQSPTLGARSVALAEVLSVLASEVSDVQKGKPAAPRGPAAELFNLGTCLEKTQNFGHTKTVSDCNKAATLLEQERSELKDLSSGGFERQQGLLNDGIADLTRQLDKKNAIVADPATPAGTLKNTKEELAQLNNQIASDRSKLQSLNGRQSWLKAEIPRQEGRLETLRAVADADIQALRKSTSTARSGFGKSQGWQKALDDAKSSISKSALSSADKAQLTAQLNGFDRTIDDSCRQIFDALSSGNRDDRTMQQIRETGWDLSNRIHLLKEKISKAFGASNSISQAVGPVGDALRLRLSGLAGYLSPRLILLAVMQS